MNELVHAELRLRLAAAREREQWFDLAVWQLVCGEPEESLATLRGRDAAEQRPELSVVAGDWERAAREARAALAGTENLVAGYRPYLRALYSLIAGLPAEADLEALHDYTAVHDRLRSGHPAAVVAIVEGLVQRSAADIRAGVDALLGWHLRRARARSEIFNSARGVISLEAVTMLLLAHRLGLGVGVDDRFRHASVPLLALHLVEWEGRPLPRALDLRLDTDLVATPWLREHGLQLDELRPPKTRAVAPRKPRRVPSRDDAEAARTALRERLRLGGSPWQLASWSLMLGDAVAARAHLVSAAAEAERQWEGSAPAAGAVARLLRRPVVQANPSFAREHFALALVLGDERSLRRTGEVLRDWDGSPAAGTPYAHAGGYLDLIRHMLEAGGPQPTGAQAQDVLGPFPSIRVACTGLVGRDEALVSEGLRSLLREHTATLERRTSPPPPVCAAAVHVAVAAQRIGLAVDVPGDARWYDVPVALPDRTFARLPCDLLAVALWAGR